MLFVRWEEKYSVDRLSPSPFAEDVSSKEITHDTKWDGSDWVEARARLTVSGDKVELDYSAFDHETGKRASI